MIYLVDSAALEPHQGLPTQKGPPFSVTAAAGRVEGLWGGVGQERKRRQSSQLPP